MSTSNNQNSNSEQAPVRTPIVIGIVVVVAAVLGIVVMSSKKKSPADADAASAAKSQAVAEAKPKAETVKPTTPAPRAVATPAQPAAAEGAAKMAKFGNVTPETRALVSSLTNLFQPGTPITQETVDAWKKTLKDLVAKGAASVPAIMEFLDKNTDMNLAALPGGASVFGTTTLRMALFQALGDIGGPEGQSATLQMMQSTKNAVEMAFLAQSLDKMAPDQYRAAIVAAAQEALGTAANGRFNQQELWPLFKTLGTYGKADALPALQEAAKGVNYNFAMISLAQMPDGAGVPALIELASAPGAGRTRAIEMLSILADRNEQARNALLQQAQAQTINTRSWNRVAGFLEGLEVTLGDPGIAAQPAQYWSGAQGNYTVFSKLTPEQVNTRLDLLDKLKPYCKDQAVLDRLENTRRNLLARQQQGAPAAQ